MDPVQLGLIASILSGVCTAAWTVITWAQQQERVEEAKRDRNAALYVNPFIMAAEELQDALYDYLEGHYHKLPGEEQRQGYAGVSAAALEIIYTMVVYFGWSMIIYRYGPYTSDEKLIELTQQVSQAFSGMTQACQSAEDAFYFSYPEQKALGLTFVRPLAAAYGLGRQLERVKSEHLPEFPFLEFESISLYEFEEEVKNERNAGSPLYLNIQAALQALDQANPSEAFSGRQRLVLVQNYLVDLVDYLEKKEAFSVSLNKRRRARHHLTFTKVFGQVQAQMAHHIPGRMRLRFLNLKDDSTYGTQLESFFCSLEGVKDVRVNPQANSVVIEYDPKLYSKQVLENTFANFLNWV